MELLNHLWQSAIVLSMFYLVYVLFLRKDTLFAAKRHFFLVGILVAVLIPFIEITQTIYKEAPVLSESILLTDNLTSAIETTTEVTSLKKTMDWGTILMGIYGTGVLLLLLRLGLQCRSLIRLIRSYPIVKKGNYRFVQVSENLSPFSFFRYIVYNPQLHSEEELEMILQHEKIHVSQWHSLDILLGNFIQIAQWINPFSWLYKRSMEENLEYIADGKTIDRVASKKQYQLTMVKASASWKAPSLTIQFYQSFIKKRIVMLNKQHSKKRNALKAMIILPLLALFLWGFNVKQVIEYQEPEAVITVETDISEETTPVLSEATASEPELEVAETPISAETEAEAVVPEKRTPLSATKMGENPLFIINGNETRGQEYPKDGEMSVDGEINVYYPKEAVQKFGAKGNQGVVVLNGNVNYPPRTRQVAAIAQSTQFRYQIHKNSTDGELKRMKDELREDHGIDLSYTVVRNNNGEITSINMSYSGKNKNGSYSVTEDDDTPIEEFEFYMLDDGETGFYSEAHRLRREERMKARLAEMEEREEERLARRTEEMEARVEERERRVIARGEASRARSDEMRERSKELAKERRDEMKERRKEMKERSREMRDRSRSLARTSRNEGVRVYSDSGNYVRINKNTTDAELEQMKRDLADKGVTFNFRKVKRNSRGEITSIKVEVKDDKGRSQTSIRSDTDDAIEEMIIEY